MNRDFENKFVQITYCIEAAHQRALQKANKELIKLYWDIGKCITEEYDQEDFEEIQLQDLSDFICNRYEGLNGFDLENLSMMKLMYETYKEYEFVYPLVFQVNWTNNMLILQRSKTMREREFYLRLSIRENYSKKELEVQFNNQTYRRHRELTKKKSNNQGYYKDNSFFDEYTMEFLKMSQF